MPPQTCVLPRLVEPISTPLLEASQAEQNLVRERSMGVTAIAGFAGLCEISLPVARDAGAPVSLSLVAAPGRDRALLDLACRLAESIGLPG